MTTPTDLLSLALDWHFSGRGVALATVIETWGSAPRSVGSHMIIDETGAMDGSVSGGCVEAAVVTQAIDAITQGRARITEYGVTDEDAFAVGLACGGTIRILIEPIGSVLPIAVLKELVAHRIDRQPIAYVTDLGGDARRLANRDEFPDRFRLNQSGIEGDARTFVAIYNPPLRLIIVGAVHIAQHLVTFARTVGFDPIVIDPRSAFATPARFPETNLVVDWPDAAMKDLQPDLRTAIVTLTHDPKLDDLALIEGFKTEAFYIGSLGSKRTHEKRIERLAAHGVSKGNLARIHGPVGLDIGGRNPAEIAVSVMAEIIQTQRKSA